MRVAGLGSAAGSARPPTSRSPLPHFTLHRVGTAPRAVLLASGRIRTACQPSCLSRAPLAGRGKASPCPPMKTRTRRSHAPTLVASRIERSAIPTSNNATPRSGDTTPCPRVPMSTCPLAASLRAPTSNNAHTTVAQRPPSIQPINESTIQQTLHLQRSTQPSVLDSALCPLITPLSPCHLVNVSPRGHRPRIPSRPSASRHTYFPAGFLKAPYDSAKATNCA